jgi:hypothetical protein
LIPLANQFIINICQEQFDALIHNNDKVPELLRHALKDLLAKEV